MLLTRTVYADVLIVLNTCLTFLLLLCSARIVHTSISAGRLTAAALLGGAYSLLIFAPPMNFFISLLIKSLFSFSIIKVGFKPSSVRLCLKLTGIFFAVSLCFAGSLTAVAALLKFKDIYYINGAVYYNFSFSALLISAVLAYLIFRVAARLFPASTKNQTAVVEIGLGNVKIKGRALCDTGNLLTDGYFGTPVILINYRLAQEALGVELEALVNFPTEQINTLPEELATRFRLISTRGIRDTALLPAFRADYAAVDCGKEQCLHRNISIALTEHGFADGEFDLLLNPHFWENGSGNRKRARAKNSEGTDNNEAASKIY